MTESGATSMEGDMPVNCSGGVLSSNPIGASGMLRFAEAALQVRGHAGEHQVDGARRALGHAYGGAAQYFSMWVVGSEMLVAVSLHGRRSSGGGRSRVASKSALVRRSIRRRRRASSSTRASSSRTGPSRTASTPIPRCSSSSRARCGAPASRSRRTRSVSATAARSSSRSPATSRRSATSCRCSRRGAVVPAVQRARRGIRPREPEHARRARRRRLRRERTEDLDVTRRRREVRHPDRSHPDRRVEAPRHLVLHHPDGPRPASRSARSAT